MARKAKVDADVPGDPFVQITLYVPSADRDGRPMSNQQEWKAKALVMFAGTFGKGATAMPRAEGIWLNPETKQLVKDKPILVHCYVSVAQAGDLEKLQRLREFCLEMGHAMHQGEVLLVIGDRMIFIPTF